MNKETILEHLKFVRIDLRDLKTNFKILENASSLEQRALASASTAHIYNILETRLKVIEKGIEQLAKEKEKYKNGCIRKKNNTGTDRLDRENIERAEDR